MYMYLRVYSATFHSFLNDILGTVYRLVLYYMYLFENG